MDAQTIIDNLALEPHPEGGFFRRTFATDAPAASARPAMSAIYFLLRAGEISRWHRIDAVEMWHFYAGSPLHVELADESGTITAHGLGVDFAAGQRPQIVVPPKVWQRARSLGDFTLVGCTVAPAFVWEFFEMADADWSPDQR